MLKSSKPHLDEEDEPDGYDSSSVKGKEKALNPHRSKHSETEQRRRSKINERFQILRGLIPQNDQKRDRASFLLEVIEYIQFLQEKLLVYEGSYEAWGQDSTKLIPWKNHCATAESLVDHSQMVKSGLAVENPAMVPNVLNSMGHDVGTAPAAVHNSMHHVSGSTLPAASLGIQAQANVFSGVGRGEIPRPFEESVLDAENRVYQLHTQQGQSQQCATDLEDHNGQEDLTDEGELVSFSNAYSQGVLNTLTQVLQSSGVNLSRTSISVQIDVGKRASSKATANQGNQHASNQVIEHFECGSCEEDSNKGHKRRRTEKSESNILASTSRNI